MTRFIETIKLKDGNYRLLDYHNRRINDTVGHFFGKSPRIDLAASLPDPSSYQNGIYKCRLVYADRIENIDIAPYSARTIKRLKVTAPETAPGVPGKCRQIDYRFKYEDRDCLSSFLSVLGAEEDALFVKNDRITDTSFSNVILFDGENWITPDTYLLNGVKRRYLLENRTITEREVSAAGLYSFKKISLINAMLEPGDIEIDIHDVY